MKKVIKIIVITLVPIVLVGFAASILIQKNTNNLLAEIEYDKKAYKTLCKASDFSCGKVGYGGDMSEETKAYSNLIQSEHAKEIFHCLEKDANMQGKLYALSAFYYLDRNYYQKQVQEYLKSSETVKMLFGCMGYTDSVSNVMKTENESNFLDGEIPKELSAYIEHEKELSSYINENR